jgi:hypothetical protein
MNTLIMHQTTWDYVKKATIKHGYCPKEFGQAQYNGSWTFSGIEVLIDNSLKETIDETTDYIFPKEKFVFYEPKDVEWCEPVGIGRWGRGVIIGEIYSIAENQMFKWNFSSDKVAIIPTVTPKRNTIKYQCIIKCYELTNQLLNQLA